MLPFTRRCVLGSLMVGLLMLPLFCQWSVVAQQIPLAPPEATHPDKPLLLGPGDLLHISVLGAPEFDRDVRVSESGKIALPFAGEVLVGGSTTEEAERAIAHRLSSGEFFTDPQVSILVKEYATQGVSVLGEVQKPGIYSLLGSHTLFDAISAAGGTTAKAGQTVTITHRSQPDKPEVTTLHQASDHSIRGNVDISPGDTVVVSKAGMVYVVGDVKQPTAIVLENPDLTVLQAIAIAQGANTTASLDNSKILRQTKSGMLEISVPLKKILSAKLADVPMQSDDVLFVPQSTAKKAAIRTLEAVVQTATGLAIYAH